MQQKMKTMFVILFLLVLVLPACAGDVSYEIRSAVYDNKDSSAAAGDFYWDANMFPAFWYQIKPGLTSEVLYIDNTWNPSSVIRLGDTIPEGDLYYVSKPQVKKTKIGGSDDSGTFIADGVDLEKYYLAGLFGAQHVVMAADPSDLSHGCKPDEIAKILIDSDDKKTMFAGEEWKFQGGWSLVVQEIDVEGNKVWLELKKDGEVIDSGILSTDAALTRQERTYLYKDSDDNPVFYCYAASAFRGAGTDLVVFEYVFLISDIIRISEGDKYGIFGVEGFSVPSYLGGINYAGSGAGTVLNEGDDAIVMASTRSIKLKAGQDYDLYGDICLRTEDTISPDLKMSLRKKYTVKVDECPECPQCPQDNTTADGKEQVMLSNVDIPHVNNSVTESESDTPATVSSSAIPGFTMVLAMAGVILARRIKE